MKNINYILILRTILMGLNSFELFAILLTLFGYLSAVIFTGTFLSYYITFRKRKNKSNSKLLTAIYLLSRITALTLVIYPTYLQFGISNEFGLYVLCAILLEASFEIKVQKNISRNKRIYHVTENSKKITV